MNPPEDLSGVTVTGAAPLLQRDPEWIEDILAHPAMRPSVRVP